MGGGRELSLPLQETDSSVAWEAHMGKASAFPRGVTSMILCDIRRKCYSLLLVFMEKETEA